MTTGVEKLMMEMLLSDSIKNIKLTNQGAGCGLVEQDQTARVFYIHDIGAMTKNQLALIDSRLNWCMALFQNQCMSATNAIRLFV